MSNKRVKPIELKVENYLGNRLGVNTYVPRLSWKYSGNIEDDTKVVIKIEHHLPGKKVTEEFVKVDGNNNNYLPWPIKPLLDRELVSVSIKVDEDSDEWSDKLEFDVGILNEFVFEGRFIGYPECTGKTDHRPQPIIRREFNISAKPKYARLYLTSLGLVEAEANGNRVGEDILTPGWTDYDNRLKVEAYDISDSLRKGKNVLGFYLADGWYRGRTGPVGGQVNYYGDKIGVYVELHVIDEDDNEYTIASNSYDEKWKTTMGPLVRSNIYEGEWFDQRKDISGWLKPDFETSDWQDVSEVPFDRGKMYFAEDLPIRMDGIHKPVSIFKNDQGWIVDFGQNCTQRISINVHGLSDGQELIVNHVEVLNPDGTPAIRPLRRGIQQDKFISSGKDMTWETKFTIHGFRYAQIIGWQGDLTEDDLVAKVYHSEMKQNGKFNCSNDMVNRLHDNTLWSMRSNFVSIPTDCPQRDERLGWTGDIALFAPTACDLYDTTGFLSNWLEDVGYERDKFGTLPVYTPYMPFAGWKIISALAIWGDAATIVPWSIYMNSGDKKVLKRHYPLAKKWVDEVITYLSDDGVWDRKPAYDVGQLGDWLDPTAPPDEPVKAMTQKELVATAFFINSCSILSEMNSQLGLKDAEYYKKIADKSKAGFKNRFFKSNGYMTSDTQCAYSLAIEFGILDDFPELLEIAGNRLDELILKAGNTIATGFAGTPYILNALLKTNHISRAYKLFLSDKCPSWMYQIKMGGTTTWERWDSLLPNGEVNPGEMTSFNHYALGSVTHWIYSTVGGLKTVKPGWREFLIAPRPGGNITNSSVSHITPNGLAKLNWEVSEDEILLHIHVPFKSVGVISFKSGEEKRLNSGSYDLRYPLEKFV